jgi:hypothetical protein
MYVRAHNDWRLLNHFSMSFPSTNSLNSWTTSDFEGRNACEFVCSLSIEGVANEFWKPCLEFGRDIYNIANCSRMRMEAKKRYSATIKIQENYSRSTESFERVLISEKRKPKSWRESSVTKSGIWIWIASCASSMIQIKQKICISRLWLTIASQRLEYNSGVRSI